MDYKDRLVCLDMLPLMYVLELNDVLFCIKSLKETSPSFNIRNFITFSKCSTRSGKVQKMNLPQTSTTMQKHHYFNRLPKLWNSFPPTDLDLSVDVIKRLYKHLNEQFKENFISILPCTFHPICPCTRCMFASASPTYF